MNRDVIHDSLADFLAALETDVTQRWLEAVAASDGLPRSQRLTRRELIDHLPQLYRALCAAVSSNEPDVDADKNARLHGTYRWREGYQLDELVRELDILREIVNSELVTRFTARPNPRSVRLDQAQEIAVRKRVDEFFREMSIASIKEFMAQHDAAIAHFTTELQDSNRALQLAASQRQRLMAVLAHELRNFVQALGAMTELWERHPNDANIRNIAKAQIADMHSLLQQLLEHSTLLGQSQPLNLETFSPEGLCSELTVAYKSAAEAKGLHLLNDCTDAPATVRGDRLKTKQIMANVLSNAIKYTQHGEIYVSVTRAKGERWQVHVVDTGPGMPQAAAERMHSGLGGADDLLPGRGIGLGIARDLVDMLGGEIEIRSVPGEGTHFTVSFPMALTAADVESLPIARQSIDSVRPQS